MLKKYTNKLLSNTLAFYFPRISFIILWIIDTLLHCAETRDIFIPRDAWKRNYLTFQKKKANVQRGKLLWFKRKVVYLRNN